MQNQTLNNNIKQKTNFLFLTSNNFSNFKTKTIKFNEFKTLDADYHWKLNAWDLRCNSKFLISNIIPSSKESGILFTYDGNNTF